MNDELSRALHKAADEFEMSSQMPRRVARKVAIRRALAVGTIALVLIGGSAGVLYGAGALRDDAPGIGPAEPEPTATVPDHALIVCTQEGAEAVTPQVRPQPDGIHITIDNRADKNEFYIRDAEMSSPNHGGRLELQASNEVVTTFGPGDILVGCFDEPADFSDVEGQGYATLTIVDPEGLWTPDELSCGQPAGLRSETTIESNADESRVEQLAREAFTGIRPEDELRASAYPGTQWKSGGPMLTVIRDGESIALLGFGPQDGGWHVLAWTCPDSGIAPKSGTTPESVEIGGGYYFYNDSEHSFEIGYPANWFRAEESMTPNLGDPEEIVALATYQLVYRETDCNHMPKSALDDLGPRDAFVTIQERRGDVSDYPPRPDDFKEASEPQSGFECSPMEGEEIHWIAFRDEGRGFYALVAFGPEAETETRDQAWGILNDFEPEPTE